MVGLPRGASSGPFAHVCALLIASGQNSRRTEPSLGFRPTSLGFLHREPRGGPALPRGPSPPEGVCPALAAVLAPLPSQGLCFPRTVRGQLEKSSPGAATRHLLT